MSRHRALIATVLADSSLGSRILILPESALGFWTPTIERLWIEGLEGADIIVIAGATKLDATGYDNVLVALTGGGASILYRERMPVPGSMWQPWRSMFGLSGGARAYFFDNPSVTVGGQRLAPLICYEQLVVWPVLESMFDNPDVIVAIGNGWWTKGTSIVEIQLASVQAWARLFDKSLVFSFNR
jgi:hypothetical protein